MSGERFDYLQYHITTIADAIESELEKQGKEIPKDELFCSEEYYKQYPQEKYYRTYPKEIQKEMVQAVKILRQAAIYAHRIDWYLSHDDGDESFLERLKEELKNS